METVGINTRAIVQSYNKEINYIRGGYNELNWFGQWWYHSSKGISRADVRIIQTMDKSTLLGVRGFVGQANITDIYGGGVIRPRSLPLIKLTAQARQTFDELQEMDTLGEEKQNQKAFPRKEYLEAYYNKTNLRDKYHADKRGVQQAYLNRYCGIIAQRATEHEKKMEAYIDLGRSNKPNVGLAVSISSSTGVTLKREHSDAGKNGPVPAPAEAVREVWEASKSIDSTDDVDSSSASAISKAQWVLYMMYCWVLFDFYTEHETLLEARVQLYNAIFPQSKSEDLRTEKQANQDFISWAKRVGINPFNGANLSQ